jgi:replicative DNA helicase
MAAQPHDRPDLQPPELRPVPDPDPTADVVDTLAAYFEDRELDQLHPEHNLVGALLHQPASAVAPVLELVEDTDLEHLLPRVVFGIIRALVAQGHDPDPMAVVAVARNAEKLDSPPDIDLDIEEVPARYRRVAKYVIDAYTIGMPTTTRSAARQVVEDAYRRDFAATGTRIAQMADNFADVEDLEQATGTALRRWRRTRARLHALAARPTGTAQTTGEPRDPQEDTQA